MNTNDIQSLLEKYYAGLTSLQEEQQLREYFKHTQNIPLQLQAEKTIFSTYTSLAQTEHPRTADILGTATQVVPLSRKLRLFFDKPAMAIAASLLIICAIAFYSVQPNKHTSQPVLTDTYETPEKARAAAKRILALVSKQYNKGTTQLTELQQFNQALGQLKVIRQIPLHTPTEARERRRSL